MKQKISAMLLDVARDYIALGEDTEQKRQLLRGAVSAWNIACLPPEKSRSALDGFMREYKRMNPGQTKQDYRDVREDTRLLIKRKRELFPEVTDQILDAQMEEANGRMYVQTATIRLEKQKFVS